MEKVDKDLLRESEELMHTKYSDNVTYYDITCDLLEEAKYWKNKYIEETNPPLEDFDDPRYEYDY